MRAPGLSLAILALTALVVACSGGEVQHAVEAFETPTPAVAPAEPASTVTLKVVSFNVLYGAGIERRFDQHVGPGFKGRDRMPDLLDFLRETDPDLLAIQETAGWDTGDPSVAHQVAADLGMSYVLAPDAWELHVVLFSKYPIVAANYVSRHQGFNGVALRATVAVEPDVLVNVVAVHLNSMSRDTRACQVEALFDMVKDLTGRTILLGDMNFRSNSPQADVLREGGWDLVAVQEAWPIDQVWLDARGGEATRSDWWTGFEMPAGISDHLPAGAEVTFEAPRTQAATREPVTEPTALDYACPLPS
jgi:hypothetical protein